MKGQTYERERESDKRQREGKKGAGNEGKKSERRYVFCGQGVIY